MDRYPARRSNRRPISRPPKVSSLARMNRLRLEPRGFGNRRGGFGIIRHTQDVHAWLLRNRLVGETTSPLHAAPRTGVSCTGTFAHRTACHGSNSPSSARILLTILTPICQGFRAFACRPRPPPGDWADRRLIRLSRQWLPVGPLTTQASRRRVPYCRFSTRPIGTRGRAVCVCIRKSGTPVRKLRIGGPS